MAAAMTIPELFDGAVARIPDKVWLLHEEESFTYAEAAARIGGIAAALSAAGIGRGEIVMATARNEPSFVFLWLAVVRLGAIYVGVNPQSSDAELHGLVEQVGPALLLQDTAELIDAPPAELRPSEVGPDYPAVLIPTSGTTGRSKLVTQTHRAYAWAGEGFPYWMGLTPEDRLMTSLPLFHVNAPAYSILGSVGAGASVALLPRFSASGFLDAARRHGATEFNAIGAMLEILMAQPDRPDDADNPLRLCYTGPSPTRERQLEIEERFGLEIVCGYALSESPYALIWPHGQRPFGTLGTLRQHPSLGVVNEGRVVEDGRDVEVGEVGELWLRNPVVMQGYWGMPEETAAVVGDDGWLRTGDLVRREPGGLFTFVARVKDVIRRRGENLAPAEVEAALAEHPSVVEAAVIGVPSALSEEEVKAFVVAAGELDLADLREFAAGRLTRFKVPRYLEVVDELPHTPTGRIAKHRLPAELTGGEWDSEEADG
jgi:crotonobetaine/carnitine-CoA ligase